MDTPDLIQDLAIVLVAAGICAFVFHRLRQPVVLGYIAAGVLVGPHLIGAGLVREPGSIETLGGLGVVFLLFSLGLDFNLTRIRKMGFGALLVGCLEMPLMLLAGYYLGGLLGWGNTERLFLGAIVSISSTTIIVKILGDLGRSQEPFARLIYAVLVVEDLLAVVILAALSAVATTGTADVKSLTITGFSVFLFIILTAVGGSLFVPRIVRRLAGHGAGEMLVIALMGVLFAITLLALKLGYSVALGSFIAGAIVGETREVRSVERLVTPLRDVFGAVFFVSVGLEIDPAYLADLWAPILAVAGLVIAGKMTACSFGAFVAGYEPRTALSAGMGLAQIGEFSFIIAQLGMMLGVIPTSFYSLTVGVSAVTAFVSPHLIRSSGRLMEVFERRAPAPVVTYCSLYGRWVAGLSVPGTASQVFALVRKPVIQMFFNMLAVAGIFLGSRAFLPEDPARQTTGAFRALVWTGASLVAMPFLIAAWRKVRAICLVLAEAALLGRSIPEARMYALRNLLANTVSLLAALLLAMWVLAASAPSLPPLPVLAAAVAFLTMLTIVLYRWMVRFQATLQAGLQKLAERAPENDDSPAASLDLLRKYYPYGMGAFEMELPRGAAAEGKSLREMGLRTRTGATILAVERAGSPVAELIDAPLRAGDRLLLTGEEDQISRARRALTSGD